MKLHTDKIAWTVLVLVTTPFIIYLVPQLLGVEAYTVTSGSMKPQIPEGAVVYTETPDIEQLAQGDVIVFTPENREIQGERVVHRIIDTKTENYSRFFKTKGDANPEPDPGWTPPPNIQGKKIFTIPHLGTIIQTAQTLPVIAATVAIPATILLKNQINKLLKELEKTPQNQERIYRIQTEEK